MNWDNHVFQHEIHQMLVPELDASLHLITISKRAAFSSSTLVIAMGELVARRGSTLRWPRSLSKRVEHDDDGCGLKRASSPARRTRTAGRD